MSSPSTRIPVVAIVGRTNVGKSTLFNAIAGHRIAVVEDSPGVTRDRNYHLVTRFEQPFTIIDTGGLFGEEELKFNQQVRSQSELAIAEADIVIGLFDAKHGPHSFDAGVAQIIRRSGKPVIWVINKCEKKEWALGAGEFYSLGIDEPLLVSAANGRGIKEIVNRIFEITKDLPFTDAPRKKGKGKGLKIAIVGKPNVGKSTLINKLLGEERLIASPIAGTTRDSVDVELTRDGKSYILIDTAGLRRKSKVDDESIERFSNLRTLSSLARCDVAVLLIDATEGFPSDQDLRIATLIHERGRCFIIAVNKWDAVDKDSNSAKEFEFAMKETFNFAKYAPLIFMSGLTGQRCPNIIDTAAEVFAASKVKIADEDFMKCISDAMTRNPPPVYHGAPVECYGGGQTACNPPIFTIYVNHPEAITPAYERFLRGAIRESFPFPGSNIKLELKKKTRRAAQKEQLQSTSGDTGGAIGDPVVGWMSADFV